MEIVQTATDGLKREFRVTVTASEIDRRVTEKLGSLGQKVRIPGFRPGKAPTALLRKQYGQSVLGEVLQETVSTATQQAVRDHQLRPALQPKVEVQKFEEGSDLECTLAIEVLPDIEVGEMSQIKIEKPVAEVPGQAVDDMLSNLMSQHKSFEKVDRAAAMGDAVAIDFAGSIDGALFEGGSAKDHVLELGSNSFIPGFEAQMVGAKAAEHRDVNVSFPADYGQAALAGKAAVFSVDIKEVRAPKAALADDEFAKQLGLENLAALRDAVKNQLEQSHSRLSRDRMKRNLMDQLAAAYTFPVPVSMVEMEYNHIWKELESHPGGVSAEGERAGMSEDELKADYQAIADRRVRLGLLLSELGKRHNVEVKPEEIQRAVIEQARRFPGQERAVIDHFQKNPEAMANLRAPIFEEKVVDLILSQAHVTERKVSREELMRDPDEAAEPAGGEKSGRQGAVKGAK
jgi:trigger factor